VLLGGVSDRTDAQPFFGVALYAWITSSICISVAFPLLVWAGRPAPTTDTSPTWLRTVAQIPGPGVGRCRGEGGQGWSRKATATSSS